MGGISRQSIDDPRGKVSSAEAARRLEASRLLVAQTIQAISEGPRRRVVRKTSSCCDRVNAFFELVKANVFYILVISLIALLIVLSLVFNRITAALFNAEDAVRTWLQSCYISDELYREWEDACDRRHEWMATKGLCVARAAVGSCWYTLLWYLTPFAFIVIIGIVIVYLILAKWLVINPVYGFLSEMVEEPPKSLNAHKDSLKMVKYTVYFMAMAWAFVYPIGSYMRAFSLRPVVDVTPVDSFDITRDIIITDDTDTDLYTRLAEAYYDDDDLVVNETVVDNSTHSVSDIVTNSTGNLLVNSITGNSTQFVSTSDLKSEPKCKPARKRKHKRSMALTIMSWATTSCVALNGFDLLWSLCLDPVPNPYDKAVLVSRCAHCAVEQYLWLTGNKQSYSFMYAWKHMNAYAFYGRAGKYIYDWDNIGKTVTGLWPNMKVLGSRLYAIASIPVKAILGDVKSAADFAGFVCRLFDCKNANWFTRLVADVVFDK